MTPGVITERELLSQPERWQRLLERTTTSAVFPQLDFRQFYEIVIFGSGSSYYLALLLGDLIERARRVAVGISRSGESSEALLAADVLKAEGIPLLALGCDKNSSLAKKAQYHLMIPEGAEEGLVMLRSFTSMLLGLQLFLNASAPRVLEALNTLPAIGKRLLEHYRPTLKTLANRADFKRFVFLGSGLVYPLALESALKVQEMALATSEAYHSLEYRHGPKATAASDTLVTLFALGSDTYGVDLIRDLKDYDVTTLVIAENVGAYRNVADEIVELGSGLNQADRLILTLLPAQLLAFETALRLEQNPDVSRNLSQVVKF
jgi:glutamine---fructose-6-phosphate transaminase (isomerizing)